MKFSTNFWKYLWKPIADINGLKKERMDTADNTRQSNLTAPVVESLLDGSVSTIVFIQSCHPMMQLCPQLWFP